MGLVQTKIEIGVETSPQLIESLHMAREVALKSDVAEVLPGHLLLAMLEDDESSFLLDAYGVDFDKLRMQLGKIVQKQTKPKTLEQHAVFSDAIEQIMRHAREQAQKNALAEVDSNLVLAVLLSEEAGFLKKLLIPYDLDTSGVLQYLELREGKTVDIDPLPSIPKPTVKTVEDPPQNLTKAPVNTSAPPSVHNPNSAQTRPQGKAASIAAVPNSPVEKPKLAPTTPTRIVTPQSTSTPRADTSSPDPGNSAAPKPPMPQAPQGTQVQQGTQEARGSHNTQSSQQHPAGMAPDRSSKNTQRPMSPTPIEAQAIGNHETPTPIPPNNQGRPNEGPANQQKPVEQSGKPSLFSPNATTTTPRKTPNPAPSGAAPSRLRSLFSSLGKIGTGKSKDEQKKNNEAPDVSNPAPLRRTDTVSQLASQNTPPMPTTPPVPAPTIKPAVSQPPVQPVMPSSGGAPTPANNNQSPSPFKTASAVKPKPEMPVAPNPSNTTVEQLVDPSKAPQAHTPPSPQTTAPLSHQNRPAKRRRAAPTGRGATHRPEATHHPEATGSLSATGSVLEKGRLVEAVPRKMQVNKPSQAEVRITRDQLDEINREFEDLSDSHVHELAVTEAMTVQLRAPGSGFHIENLSPQTQWIDRNQRHINDADFGIWRWNVTPVKSGKSRLQLVISARTVDDEGNIHIADIPDKIIELAIARDYGKTTKKAAIIAFLVITSLVVGRYGEVAYQWLSMLVSKYS